MSETMRPLKIFYSWQMDHPSQIGRNFIRRALDEAILRLAAEGVALEVDSDTQGVPGTPPVSDTILAKIRDCDLFLADVTFVAQANDKRLPNPNVMAECGYALRDKGTRRMLLVMNTAFGPPDQLPFDLRHLRHPAQYEAPKGMPDGPRRAARERLGVQLGEYILAAARDAQNEITRSDRERRAALQAAWWQAVQQRPLNERPALVSSPSAVVHIVPAAVLDDLDLDPRDVRPHRSWLHLSADGVSGGDGIQWSARGPLRRIEGLANPVTGWYGRMLGSGIVEYELNLGGRIDDDPTIVIRGARVETEVIDAADHGLALATALGLDGPCAVGVILYGLDDVELSGGNIRRFPMQTLDLPLSLVPAGVTQAGDFMRRAFDRMWMAAGFDDGSPSFEETQWKGYRDPTYRPI